MPNTPSKPQIGWAILVVAGLIATLFFGVKYPLPEPPPTNMQSRDLNYSVPCYTASGGRSIVVSSGCTLDIQSGGAQNYRGRSALPLITGVATDVVSGTVVTHGLGAIPKVVLLTTGSPSMQPWAITLTNEAFTVRVSDTLKIPVLYWAVGE